MRKNKVDKRIYIIRKSVGYSPWKSESLIKAFDTKTAAERERILLSKQDRILQKKDIFHGNDTSYDVISVKKAD
jgi:hypothetical protein